MRWRLAAVILPSAVACAMAQAPARPIDRRALLSDLRILSADDMQGREVGTPGSDKARAFIVSRFAASGLAPIGNSYEHPFTFVLGRAAERRGVNVVGQARGTSPSDRVIVISAHYDHVGIRGGEVFNGANDNASGTAALFAIAQALAASPPRHAVVFVAFDGEEVGLRGARAFVAAPPIGTSSIAVNLNMDMIGRDPTNTLFVSGVSTQPALRPFIERVAKTAPVRLLMGYDGPTGDNWVRDSDQFAFIEARIPALYFGVEDYAQHHKPTDDYDTITHEFYVRAVETMLMVLRDFDAHLETLPRTAPVS